MLAFAPPEEREALMRGMTPVRYTKKTIATFPALRKALEQIRRDGYAIGDEERDEGVRGVAAPVLSGGFARYGVAVTAPSYRLTGARLQEVTEAVRAAAAKITEALRPTEF
jgi:DNA-binding IclR family transcriptional regulator